MQSEFALLSKDTSSLNLKPGMVVQASLPNLSGGVNQDVARLQAQSAKLEELVFDLKAQIRERQEE